jgi:hypothetical protein
VPWKRRAPANENLAPAKGTSTDRALRSQLARYPAGRRTLPGHPSERLKISRVASLRKGEKQILRSDQIGALFACTACRAPTVSAAANEGRMTQGLRSCGKRLVGARDVL